MKIRRRRGCHRLGRRSARLLEIPWQIVPNNSLNLLVLTTEHRYVMSPHIVQTFFSVDLYGTKSQTVKIVLAIREVRPDQGDVNLEQIFTSVEIVLQRDDNLKQGLANSGFVSQLKEAWCCLHKFLFLKFFPFHLKNLCSHGQLLLCRNLHF